MLAVFGGALTVFLVYAFVLWWGWRRAERSGDRPTGDDSPGLSIIVAVRNEEEDLPALLRALDRQTHPMHEVVIVDDASTDGTNAIASEWVAERPYATLERIADPTFPRKKTALARGIEAAEYDLLAFTDADCRPPPEWASVLAQTHAGSESDLVLVGYSPLEGAGLLGYYSRYETLIEALYATASIGLGRPYMAVGRNLSYPRSVFTAVDGYSHSDSSLSGDDDLFVQAVHRRTDASVRALLDERTFVPSRAPDSWRAWLQSRRRHVSAGRHYDWTVGIHLTLLHVSLIILWFAPVFLGKTGIGMLATALLARHSSLGPAADRFRETDLLAVFPLWELAYALYHLLVVPLGLLWSPDEW